ncbi:winged helix-turn-helix transcriptional regulator [Micromonospora globbae]|uniref:winged helix-turn-helix transcriptional regulator n=1 Tax=Micromonospora globbae TaxID=1894969 RepID=UPI00343F3F86
MDLRGLRNLLEVISHKWDLEILSHLHEQPLRYTDLKVKIASDLSEGVLSKNLNRLMADGLIHRRTLGDHHHLWELTPKGQQMIVGLAQITHVQAGTDGSAAPPAEHEPNPDQDGGSHAEQDHDGKRRHRSDDQQHGPHPDDGPGEPRPAER